MHLSAHKSTSAQHALTPSADKVNGAAVETILAKASKLAKIVAKARASKKSMRNKPARAI
jgi:hypothetical protein